MVNEGNEEEMQELRNDLNKKQREIISMKFDLDDKIYQLESANNTINMLKIAINELQVSQDNDRN